MGNRKFFFRAALAPLVYKLQCLEEKSKLRQMRKILLWLTCGDLTFGLILKMASAVPSCFFFLRAFERHLPHVSGYPRSRVRGE